MSETYTGKRLLPDEIEEAFKATGLTPIRGQYFCRKEGKPCACGIGAYLNHKLGLRRVRPGLATAAGLIGLDHRYALGFVMGFDNDSERPHELAGRCGYEDGKTAAARVFPEQETTR